MILGPEGDIKVLKKSAIPSRNLPNQIKDYSKVQNPLEPAAKRQKTTTKPLNICRICMEDCKLSKPIFKDSRPITTVDKIHSCFDIKIKFHDLLPKRICLECFEAVEKAYKLKQNVLESKKILEINSKLYDDRTEAEKEIEEMNDFLKQMLGENHEVKKDSYPLTECTDDLFDYKLETYKKSAKIDHYRAKQKKTITTGSTVIPICTNNNPPSPGSPPSEAYNCESCEMFFTCKSQLKMHNARRHMTAEERDAEKKYLCQECGKRFWTPSKLRDHGTVHSTVKAFKCEICLAEYAVADGLKRHQIRKHGFETKYICVCEERFLNPCEKNYHQKKCNTFQAQNNNGDGNMS